MLALFEDLVLIQCCSPHEVEKVGSIRFVGNPHHSTKVIPFPRVPKPADACQPKQDHNLEPIAKLKYHGPKMTDPQQFCFKSSRKLRNSEARQHARWRNQELSGLCH